MVAYNRDKTKYVIKLNVGDVLIAREDFIHAGASYDFDNKVTCTREPDATYYTTFDDEF